MSLSEEFDQDSTSRRLAKVRAERDAATKMSDLLASQVEKLERELAVVRLVGDAAPPKWLTPKKSKRDHHATLGLALSDCHFDEVVKPEEIGNVNAYSRAIAELRLRMWAESVVEQATGYLSGLTWDGVLLAMLGDTFSGNLHDLAETNEDTIFGSLLHWCEQLCAAIIYVQEALSVPVHIPFVVGNHGRQTFKPRTKLRARDNADWMLGHMIAQHFASNPDVTVSVGDDADAFAVVYETRHLLTHGDQVTGGSGIGGIWPPIMRMLARKRTRYAHLPWDVCVMGHWHQYISAPSSGLIVNGSTKGYDEYAALHNFAPERPQQALWVVTPERGITWTTSVHCDDRAAEGW